MDEIENETRVLARILRTLLRRGRPETVADLVDALKCELARLRIAYTNDNISAALAWLQTNTPLVADPFKGLQFVVKEPPRELPIINRNDATQIMRNLESRLHRKAAR